MSNENFRHELGHVFDDIAGSPSAALPDRVRSSLADVPENRGPHWIAGVAAALIAAVVIGVLIVANPLHRPPSAVGPVVGSSPTPSALESPTPTETPSPTPAPSPLPSPTLPAGFACADTSGGSVADSSVTTVRVGQQAGYDRFVIEFGGGVPSYTVTRQQNATFTRSPKGDQVTLEGNAGVLVVVHSVNNWTSYSGPTAFNPQYPYLRQALLVENFEGYQQWALGIQGTPCLRVAIFTSPNRLVIDIAAS